MKRPLKCGCCSPSHVKGITIKGIDKTTGETIWEYGPGNHWRHHYGADAISGVVPNLAATLDKYAIGARAYPSFQTCGNRNTATLDANCAEALTITKLDSLDGTIVESATLTGFFCDVIGETFVGMMNGLSITNAAGLSGGDFVIVGERQPFIEFEDFTDNAATKSYVLHAHGQQAGNVYLKTRTSNETITIPHDSTAGEVEALFEATSDCVSATATGGPWPLVPISIDVEWSVAGGDISGISATNTYTGSEESVSWDYTNDTSTSIGVFTLTINTIKVGAQFKLTFPGGAEFFYTSATTNINTFVAAMGAALGSFVAINTGLVPGDDPGEVQWGTVSTNVLIMNFTNTLPHPGPVLATIVSGGGVISDSRLAGSCAAVYDTGTGGMSSAVGYMFGYSEHRPASRMFDDGGTNPTITGLNVLGIQSIGSGPSNAVIITPSLRGSGDTEKANVLERWDISGGAWAFNWEIYGNSSIIVPEVILCESGYVVCSVDAFVYGGTNYRNAARIAVSDATVVELETKFASVNAPNDRSTTVMFDDTPGSYLTWGYDSRLTDPDRPSNSVRTNEDGSDTYVNGPLLRLGAVAFGADGSSVFGVSYGALTRFGYFSEIPLDHNHVIRFWPEPIARSREPQQFRFRFANGATTAWIDWFATETEIIDALLALLGENSDPPGFGSNVTIIFSDIDFDNNPIAVIERGLMFQFLTDIGFTSGSGYIPSSYFSTTAGAVRIEIQTSTPFATPGLAAYDITNGDLIWSRAWGTVGATTISQPQYAWLQGNCVYAYGSIVDAEL